MVHWVRAGSSCRRPRFKSQLTTVHDSSPRGSEVLGWHCTDKLADKILIHIEKKNLIKGVGEETMDLERGKKYTVKKSAWIQN